MTGVTYNHRTGRLEPSLTRTGVCQTGTCRLKVLNAATFM